MGRRQSPFTVFSLFALVLSFTSSIAAHEFHGCPHEGDGGDSALNRLKNREEMPGQFDAIKFGEFSDLDVPEGVSKKRRHTWPDAVRALVEGQERRAVQVVGYLLQVKLEGQESANCYADEPSLRDFHIWLANSPDDERSEAVIVEITPRVRAQHSSWSRKLLTRLVQQHARVRVSGWLLLDQEHPEQVGKTRLTLWEIHPVLKIEVWSGGRWREL